MTRALGAGGRGDWGPEVPFIRVVVFDAWSLAEDVVRVLARRRKDWSSLLKKHRRLETASVQLRDANGWAQKLPGPHLAVEDLVALIPAQAYRPVTVREQTYWCVTLAVRLPGLGQVRIVVSCKAGVVDRTLGGAGHQPRRLDCRQDHRPVLAPVADGNVLS